MAYIYLIKYNGSVIAAAENDKKAKEAIKQYRRNEKSMDKKLFEVEAIRYFGGKKNDT